MIKASPCPPLPQSAATPVPPSRRFSSHAERPPTMTELTLQLHARSRARRSHLVLCPTQSGTLMFMTRMPSDLESVLPGVLGLDHVGVAVADLDAAVTFYRDLLGLRVVHREENLDQQVVEVILTSGEGGQEGDQLQLLMPLDEKSVLRRFLVRRGGGGLHHVAYAVSDVRSASRVLRQCGVRVLYDAPRAGTRGSQINFVHPKDTGGVLLELVEHVGADPHSAKENWG